MSHGHEHHNNHDTDVDWAAMAADLEREAGVMLPYVTEAAETAASVCRERGITVRRVLDIGSGPGVMACELAPDAPTGTCHQGHLAGQLAHASPFQQGATPTSPSGRM